MKTIRTWIYAILKYKENIVVILKKDDHLNVYENIL